jgi:16S rRNA (guanine1516-N2)-methyltransferase
LPQPPLIAVAATTPALHDPAAELAQELALPLTESDDRSFACLLLLTPERLQLQSQGRAAPGPVYADFLQGPLAYRRQHGGGRRQLLARAVGLKPGVNL